VNTVRVMIELTEEQARAFVASWDRLEVNYALYYGACDVIRGALREVLPEPINVGDRVKFHRDPGALTYEACAIDGPAAWLRHHDGRHSTALLRDLVRAS
jgi:hypothetical protein